MMNTHEKAIRSDELVIFASVTGDDSHISDVQTDMSTIDQLKNNLSEEGVQLMSITTKIASPAAEETKEPVELELYMCEKCNRTFKQKSRYERHVSNHPSEKHYLCNTCHKTFTRMSHLEKHIRTHTEERRHVCDTCGAAFILPHHLVRHALVHSGIKPFECDICHKQFTRKAGLSQHQYVHTGMRPFSCENCGKHFTDRTTLRRHMLTHSREKPFICKECEKTFRTKSACRKHYLRHFKGEASFKCGICEEMFKGQSMLNEHTLMHEQKQKTKNYRCGFCLRVFKTQIDLDAHVPLHESGLVHCCNHCHARFYTETDLMTHVSKHTETDLMTHVSKHMDGFSADIDSDEMGIVQKNFVEVHNKSMNEIGKNTINSSILEQVNNPTCNSSDNKVVVVLQIPPSSDDVKCVQNVLQIENIHQLLGSAQIDKLLVTTEKVGDSSPGLSVELSRDQQQGIQQILQTTGVKAAGCRKEICLSNTHVNSANNDMTRVDSAAHDNATSMSGGGSAEMSVASSYMLTAVSQDATSEGKRSYLLVPVKERSLGNSTATTNFTSENNLGKRGGDSVFKSNKSSALQSSSISSAQTSNATQSIVVVNDDMVSVCEEKITHQSVSQQKVITFTPQLESHGNDLIPGFTVGNNSISTANSTDKDRQLQSLQLVETTSSTKPTFFSGEFESPLHAGDILSEEESAFAIASN